MGSHSQASGAGTRSRDASMPAFRRLRITNAASYHTISTDIQAGA